MFAIDFYVEDSEPSALIACRASVSGRVAQSQSPLIRISPSRDSLFIVFRPEPIALCGGNGIADCESSRAHSCRGDDRLRGIPQDGGCFLGWKFTSHLLCMCLALQ